MSRKTEIIFLLIILIIAAFFRLWQLNSIPPGLYPDVAINGNDALESLRTGNFKVFYPENNGREGLWIWLIALSFSIFGVSIWSIKIVAAIIGILTVLGLYLLTKELFSNWNENGSRYIALLASFFLAISFWHVNFSRIGFRAILLPFILVFSFYFLFKAFRSQKILHFVISGIFFGLGFYTYTSFRMVVLILPLVFIPYWLIYKKQNLQKKFLFSIFYFLFSIFIIVLPLGIYFLQNPQNFVGRSNQVLIFSTENPLKEFGKSLILHLGMFNFYGDANWRHNFSGSPMLFWPIGILFLIGFFLMIRDLFLIRKKKNCFMFHVSCFMISWFFVMLLPGILTYEGIPHSLRTIGVIPVVYIFAGLGGWKVYQFFEKNTEKKKLLIFTSFLFLLAFSFAEFNKYFVLWAKNPEVKNAFSTDYVEIGNYLNSLSPETKKYVIVNRSGVPVPYPEGIPIPAQTVMFVENTKYGQPQSIYLLPENLDEIKIEKEGVIVPMRFDEELFGKLWLMFPEGEIQKKDGITLFIIQLTD